MGGDFVVPIPSGFSLQQGPFGGTRAPDANLGLLRSGSRTRTYNPAVTACPMLSHQSGLSLHPSTCPPSADSRRGRALSGRIGEIPHPLVSARFPLRSCSLFAGLRSGLPCSRQCENAGFPEFTRCFNPDYSGKLLFLRELRDDNSHAEPTAACSTIELCRSIVSKNTATAACRSPAPKGDGRRSRRSLSGLYH
jgi:hypothetical protein